MLNYCYSTVENFNSPSVRRRISLVMLNIGFWQGYSLRTCNARNRRSTFTVRIKLVTYGVLPVQRFILLHFCTIFAQFAGCSIVSNLIAYLIPYLVRVKSLAELFTIFSTSTFSQLLMKLNIYNSTECMRSAVLYLQQKIVTGLSYRRQYTLPLFGTFPLLQTFGEFLKQPFYKYLEDSKG